MLLVERKIIVTMAIGMTTSTMGIAIMLLLLASFLLLALLSILFLFYYCDYYGDL